MPELHKWIEQRANRENGTISPLHRLWSGEEAARGIGWNSRGTVEELSRSGRGMVKSNLICISCYANRSWSATVLGVCLPFSSGSLLFKMWSWSHSTPPPSTNKGQTGFVLYSAGVRSPGKSRLFLDGGSFSGILYRSDHRLTTTPDGVSLIQGIPYQLSHFVLCPNSSGFHFPEGVENVNFVYLENETAIHSLF